MEGNDEVNMDQDLLTTDDKVLIDVMTTDDGMRWDAIEAIAPGMEPELDWRNGPIGWIFLEPLGDRDSPEDKVFAIQHCLCKFLSLKDLKSLRRVNRFCNIFVRNSKGFCCKSVFKISDRWHKESQGTTVNGSVVVGVPWRQFTMERFAFHRHLELFITYWKKSSKELTELNVSKSSFECDGFSFIANECVQLRTLTLKDVKLKHWGPHKSRVHNSLPVVAGNQLDGADGKVMQQTLKMKMALKNLKLNEVNHISDCMFSFLSARTGYLESLELEDCGQKILDGPGLYETKTKMLEQLCRGLMSLFRVNQTSLRKLGFENIAEQGTILGLLIAEFPNGLPITELCLGIAAGDSANVIYNTFMASVARGVTVLNLEFLGPFTSADLSNILTPLEANLNALKLSVNGSTFPADTELELQGVFQRLVSLEKLEVNDDKEVNKVEMNAARGQKERRFSALRPTPERITEAHNNVKTPISSKFIDSLPPATREITLGSLVLVDEFLTDIRNFRFVAGYRRLTKLEIRGPLLKPLDKGFELITRDMKELRTLVLVDCELTDSVVTGLGPNAVQEMRNSGAYMLSLLPVEIADSANDLFDALDKAKMYNPRGENNRRGTRRRVHPDAAVRNLNPVFDDEEDDEDEDFEDDEFEEEDEFEADNGFEAEDEFEVEDEDEENEEEEDDQNFDVPIVAPIANWLPAVVAADQAPQPLLNAVHPLIGNMNPGVQIPAAPAQQILQVQVGIGNGIPNQGLPELVQAPQANALGHGNQIRRILPRPIVPRPRETNTPRSHLHHLRHLEYLDLSKNFEITDITVFDSIRNPQLKSLNLDSCPRITDFSLEHICRYHPNLEELSVKNCRQLTKYGLNQVVKGCTTIKRIYTTKIIAETDAAQFIYNMSPCYNDVVRYPTDMDTENRRPRRGAAVELVEAPATWEEQLAAANAAQRQGPPLGPGIAAPAHHQGPGIAAPAHHQGPGIAVPAHPQGPGIAVPANPQDPPVDARLVQDQNQLTEAIDALIVANGPDLDARIVEVFAAINAARVADGLQEIELHASDDESDSD